MAAEGHRVLPSTDPGAVPVAVDLSSDGNEYQLLQPAFGPDGGAKTMVDDVLGQRLPVGGAQIGTLTETAPASDTASAGLNGRLQRIAQNITAGNAGSIRKVADAFATASVAVGANNSNAVDCRGYRPATIVVPSTFDGTAIGFLGALDGVNFFQLNDIANNQVLMTVTASRMYPLPMECWDCSYLKVQAATPQTTTTTDFVIGLRS